jgi:molybdate-binding protein/DNA-binding transcriptional regulator YhcF (GntR family)
MAITFRPNEALYSQIADHFRRLVAGGKLKPGDRLPAIRELAQEVRLDPGTVARAYLELEREGVITGRRGGGSFVSATANEKYLTERQRERLGSLMERAILEALGLDFSTEEIEAAFLSHLAGWRERRLQSVTKKITVTSRSANDVIFSGSHDLAVELLASHVSMVYPDIRFSTTYIGSMAGLMALERREADIVGAHLADIETGEFNISFVERLIPGETVVLVNLVQRLQGLMIASGNPKKINGIGDLKSPDIMFVNRQRGSGTRILLDSQLLSLGIASGEVKGYQREENTHVAVAIAVSQGEADAGLGAESAAIAAGLDFIPLTKERYDLIILKETLERQALKRVVEMVQDKEFKKMLSTLSGYDLSETGTVQTIKPKASSDRHSGRPRRS